MTIAAVIAEYNPFHNGHEYHIRKAKEVTGADLIAVILSGSFVQRSEPAMFSKAARVRMALEGGADLVFEMPPECVLQSAENYALSGVMLCREIGVDYLVLGSECGSADTLIEIADYMISDDFNATVKAELKNGVSYPIAMKNALDNLCPDISHILDAPNNLLGLEYIKAIKKLSCNIKPMTFTRIGAMHDDEMPVNNFASASHIRNLLSENKDVSEFVPDYSLKIISGEIKNGRVIDKYLYDRSLLIDLRKKTSEDLADIRDVGEGIDYKLISALQEANDINGIISLTKSKRYTYARIKRIVLSSFFGLKGIDYPGYLRLLGLKKEASSAWKEIKKGSSLPVIEKITKAEDEKISVALNKDIVFDDVWASLAKKCSDYGSEQKIFPIVI